MFPICVFCILLWHALLNSFKKQFIFFWCCCYSYCHGCYRLGNWETSAWDNRIFFCFILFSIKRKNLGSQKRKKKRYREKFSKAVWSCMENCLAFCLTFQLAFCFDGNAKQANPSSFFHYFSHSLPVQAVSIKNCKDFCSVGHAF